MAWKIQANTPPPHPQLSLGSDDSLFPSPTEVPSPLPCSNSREPGPLLFPSGLAKSLPPIVRFYGSEQKRGGLVYWHMGHKKLGAEVDS